MNKLITALDNEYINKKLKNLNKYEIKYPDISYQEGIFEILDKDDINILLLSEILKGPYEIKELINKIKEKNNKLEIIVILEKKNEILEKFLLEKNINNYFYNNQLSIKDFNNLNFISKKINNNIEEIKNNILKSKYINKSKISKIKNNLKYKNIVLNPKNSLKNINKNNVEKNENIKYKYFSKNSLQENKIPNIKPKNIKGVYLNKLNYIKKEIMLKLQNNKQYIFSFCGKDSLEKSIFILFFSLILKKKNKKVLNIDLDFLSQNINTLFGVNKFPNKNIIKLNNNIIKINKNIDYLSGLEEIIQNNYYDIISKINNLKNEYDYILINLSSISNLKLTKKILEISDYNFCIFNKKENDITFNNNLLKIYNNEWGINKNKFICCFNNFNKNTINENTINKNIINRNNEKNIFFDLNLEKYKINKNIKMEFNQILKSVTK